MITVATSEKGDSLTIDGNPSVLTLKVQDARIPWRIVGSFLRASRVVHQVGDTSCSVRIGDSRQLIEACRKLFESGTIDREAVMELLIDIGMAMFWAGRVIGRAEATAVLGAMPNDGPLPQADLGVNPERSPQYR